MSGKNLKGHRKQGSWTDFSVATPEEFVRVSGGKRVINKVGMIEELFRCLRASWSLTRQVL